MPWERVRLLMRFAGYDGFYRYHCYNLYHEDMGDDAQLLRAIG